MEVANNSQKISQWSQWPGKGSIVHTSGCQVWSTSCSSNEFSQFFVVPLQSYVRDRRVDAIDCMCCALRLQSTNYAQPDAISPPTPPLNLDVPPLANPGLVLQPCRMPQWPVPQACPPWDAKFFHLTCPQQRPPCSLLPQTQQHLPHCKAPCTDTACC